MYTRKDITRWKRWSTGNCAWDWNLTILTNSICTSQNLFQKMKHKILFGFEIQMVISHYANLHNLYWVLTYDSSNLNTCSVRDPYTVISGEAYSYMVISTHACYIPTTSLPLLWVYLWPTQRRTFSHPTNI